MNLYWIDDSYDKDSHRIPKGGGKKSIERKLDVALEIKLLDGRSEYGEFIAKIVSKTTYGVLMDYQLTNVGEGNKVEYGTTWAAQLRAHQPSIPIIGLSAGDENSIPKLRMQNFLAFYKRGDLLQASPSIVGELGSIFSGYREVWSKWKRSRSRSRGSLDLLMGLLKAPKAISDLLRMAIPTALRSNWDEESPHSASRWIWHQLQGRSGFLFDELEVATYLGISKEAFCEFAGNEHFVSARYVGVFSCDERPRWWVCEMARAVGAITGEQLVGPARQSRAELLSALNVPENKIEMMLAVPHGRRDSDQAPECVIFPDQDSKNSNAFEKRVPALLQDSVIDEEDANPPIGFESKRHFKLDR